MRCEHCGAEIIRIYTMGGPAVFWASPITYWPVRDNEVRELLGAGIFDSAEKGM